jgi:hypothetical protein
MDVLSANQNVQALADQPRVGQNAPDLDTGGTGDLVTLTLPDALPVGTGRVCGGNAMLIIIYEVSRLLLGYYPYGKTGRVKCLYMSHGLSA